MYNECAKSIEISTFLKGGELKETANALPIFSDKS